MTDRRRIEARNAGLERVSRLTRWALGGGLVLSGVFSAVAAHAFGGHGTAAAAPSNAPAAGDPATVSTPPNGGYGPTAPQPDPTLTTPTSSDRFFQRPSSFPVRSSRSARVSSGGS